MQEESAFFKALGDPTRLRLATLLAIHGETCVCKLASALGVKDFSISRHLAVMRSAGMVETRRDGTWIHYRLADPKNKIEECMHGYLRDCLAEHETILSDSKRMEKALCSK